MSEAEPQSRANYRRVHARSPESSEMYIISKGMVQLFGITYRVAQTRKGGYQVTRIRDDVFVGSFACGQTIEVTSSGIDAILMRQIASAAVRKGRTSWMGALAP